MSTALVAILEDEVDDRLLELAEEFVRGTETGIVVCRFIKEDDYQEEVKGASREGHQAPSLEEIEEEAATEAREAAEAVFAPDTEYSVRSAVGRLPDEVLDVADEIGSEHLFVSAKRRSPTGKVLFRDAAQSIMLRFDGAVTINFN